MKPIKKYGYVFSRVEDCISCGLYNPISEQRGICIDCISKERYATFAEAREYIWEQNFLCNAEYYEWLNSDARPTYIHKYPKSYYKEEWVSMRNWLGIEWLSFEQAREYMITEVSHIKIKSQYDKWSTSGERPVNMHSKPEDLYKDKWIGWPYFLMNECPKTKTKYRDFEQARTFVHKQKIRNQLDFQKWAGTDKRPNDIPANPHYVYVEGRQGGWINWRDWLGPNDKWIPYKELKVFLKQFDFRNNYEYRRWFIDNNMKLYRDENDRKITLSPQTIYKEDWKSWLDFLNPKPRFLSFHKARIFARGLKLKSYNEWLKWCREGNRPNNIPVNPNSTYADEFQGYEDWLGFKRCYKRKQQQH